MKLEELSSADKEKYNRFVAGQQAGSFLQSWEWGQWQEKQGKKVYRFLVNRGGQHSNETIATIQLVQMPLPGGKYYLYAPYGPVINKNFQFSISNFQTIFNDLKLKFPKAIFFRIEPKEKSAIANLPSAIKSTNIQPGNTLVVDLTKPMDRLLTEMHPKTRYNIKVAQRHGVVVEDEFGLTVGHGLYVSESLQLIVDTANRQQYRTYPLSYYQKLVDFFMLQNHQGDLCIHVYKALHQGQLLASAVMVDFGPVRTYLFGGSSTEHRNVMAPHLLHYQAMCDAQAKGMKGYDLDGLETSVGRQADFARFKRGFGGVELSYAGAYDIVNKKVWYTIYKVFRSLNRLLIHVKT